ncbi:MAG: class I SAM-dependent methyltransferase [Oscillospiraceae bacterium]|nr:class I SAM-dependent methyltransferase [Oscillospiraceae bacterium]
MRRVSKIIEEIHNLLVDKTVLEVACGDSEFSLVSSKYAKSVIGIDLSLNRIRKRDLENTYENVVFKEMDAANLKFEDEYFDITACYNAICHLGEKINKVIEEMQRVTKKGGYLIFMCTWKMEKARLLNLLLDYKQNENVEAYNIDKGEYKIALIEKM